VSDETVQLADPFKAHLIVLAGLYWNNFGDMRWGCLLGLLCNPSFSSVLAIKNIEEVALLTILKNLINSKFN